jgi:hypothetical protein
VNRSVIFKGNGNLAELAAVIGEEALLYNRDAF